jgi:hypothetical protein
MNLNTCIATSAPRSFVAAVLVAGVLSGPSLAKATSISQTLAFHLDSNTTSLALPFVPFDPAKGGLESVQIAFNNVTLTHDWWLWNNSGVSPRQISYTAVLHDASLTISDQLDSSLVSFAPLYYSGATGLLNRVSFTTYRSEWNFLTTGAGTPPSSADFFHGSGATLPPISGQLPPQNFSPGLNLTFDPGVMTAYDPGTWDVAATNFYTASRVAVDGDITVTYRIPESFPGALAAAVWIGLGLLAGRSRNQTGIRFYRRQRRQQRR